MSLFPEDPVDRIGYRWLSTNWIWAGLHRLGLTRHPRDPFHEAGVMHDRLTTEGNKHAEHISPERKQEGFEDALNELNKDVKHPRVAAFYKWVTRRFTWMFD